MQYPTHEFSDPDARARLVERDDYPRELVTYQLQSRYTFFGSVGQPTVIGSYELLISPATLERVQASLVRHYAHERGAFDQTNGTVLRVTATPGDVRVPLCFRHDGFALAVWVEDVDPVPPIMYLSEPRDPAPPLREADEDTDDIPVPVETSRPPPAAPPPMGALMVQAAPAVIAAVVTAAGLEYGIAHKLYGLAAVSAMALLCVGAVLARALARFFRAE